MYLVVLFSLVSLIRSQNSDVLDNCNFGVIFMGDHYTGSGNGDFLGNGRIFTGSYRGGIPIVAGAGGESTAGPCVTTRVSGVTQSFRLTCIDNNDKSRKILWKYQYQDTSCTVKNNVDPLVAVDVMDGSYGINGWSSNRNIIPQGGFGDSLSYSCAAKPNMQCEYMRIDIEADRTQNCTYEGDMINAPVLTSLYDSGFYSFRDGNNYFNLRCNDANFFSTSMVGRYVNQNCYANITSTCDNRIYRTFNNAFWVNLFGRKLGTPISPETSACNNFTFTTQPSPQLPRAPTTGGMAAMPTCGSPAAGPCDRSNTEVKYPPPGYSSSGNISVALIAAILIVSLLNL